MTAVFTISASGAHLDASTLALLAEVELDEMSIRALSEDLSADDDFLATFHPPSDPTNPSADGSSTVYPWTTNGLLEAAKHLSACEQCTTERTALLATFTTAWAQPAPALAPVTNATDTEMDRHIAAALSAFDQSVASATPVTVPTKPQESAGLLGVVGKRKAGNQTTDVSGWRASGFGRAIGLRRNQALIGFATLAVAVPLLLQLRPAEQIGGVAMKSADTTAASFETAAAEFAADTEALSADTIAAAAAAETAAAAAAASSVTTDTLARIPAAELNQVLEPAALPSNDNPSAGAGAPGSEGAADGQTRLDPVPETEAAAAAIENESIDNAAPATTSATVRPTIPPATAAPLATIAPAIESSAKTVLRSKAATTAALSDEQAPKPPASAVTNSPAKPTTKAKAPAKAPSIAPQVPAPAPAPAAAATAAPAAASGQLTVPLIDPSILNLGNVGSEADPVALINRFRSSYDRARPQPTVDPALAATTPVAPAPAVTPTPAVAAPAVAAPAAAVAADPVFAEPASPATPLAPQSVERCITTLFGPDRRIVAAANGTINSRTVWVVRVESGAGTVDVVLNMASCTEILRQPVA